MKCYKNERKMAKRWLTKRGETWGYVVWIKTYLNVRKTKELTVDFWKETSKHTPIYIRGNSGDHQYLQIPGYLYHQ